MSANDIAQSIADRIAAGGELLEDGQWVDEYLTVQRRDGETVRRGAHIRIGYVDPFGRVQVTPPLPVALAEGQTGIPNTACLDADRVAADAAREAAEAERDQERARAEAAESLAAERAVTIAAKQARIDKLEGKQTTAPVSGQDPAAKQPRSD